MAFVYPPITSPQAERSEQLTRLVYGLLDAHSDTELREVMGRPHSSIEADRR